MNIPNQLSILRICLIPVFAVIFLCFPEQPYPMVAAGILILSGLTDVLDGYIARHYNQISELGKILDPLADKLTQVCVLVCLLVKYPVLLWAVTVYFLKELAMLIGGFIIMKNNIPMAGSKWFGKIGTLLFYGAMVFIIAFPELLTEKAVFGIVIGVTVYMLFTLAMYIPEFFKLKNNSKRS